MLRYIKITFFLMAFPFGLMAQSHLALQHYLDSLPSGVEVAVLVQDTSGEILFNRQADKRIPSASIIKIPILITLFSQVEEGRVNLDEQYVLTQSDIVGGTGDLQLQPPGSKHTLHYLANEMIRISDNTATNILIERVHMASVNNLMNSLGFKNTELNRLMMDFEAIEAGRQNYTSPQEINSLLLMLHSGEILDAGSRKLILQMLLECDDTSTIPSQIPKEIPIAHKSGILDYMRGDAGIIMSEKPIVISIFVENFEITEDAEEIIGVIARLAFEAYGK